MNRLHLILVVFVTLILTHECSSPVSGGGGSETTNRFTACVQKTVITGKGKPGYSVQCYNTEYIPGSESSVQSTIVADDCSYTLEIPAYGVYNLFSLPADSSETLPSAALIDISITPDEDMNYSKDYALPGSMIFLPPVDTNWNKMLHFSTYMLYLPGTPFNQQLTSSTQFPVTLNHIPESHYALRCIQTSGPSDGSVNTISFSTIVQSPPSASNLVFIKMDSQVTLQMHYTP